MDETQANIEATSTTGTGSNEGATSATGSSDNDKNGTAKPKSNRFTFPKLSKVTTVHGESVTTHPFLDISMEKELVFCRLLNDK